jgi:hypothetical protein
LQTLLSVQYDAHARDRDERVAKLARVRHAMRARQLKLVAGVQKLYPIREVEGGVFELMSRGLPSTECVSSPAGGVPPPPPPRARARRRSSAPSPAFSRRTSSAPRRPRADTRTSSHSTRSSSRP